MGQQNDLLISCLQRMPTEPMKQKKGESIDVLISYTGHEENAVLLQEKVKERFTVSSVVFLKGGYCVHRYVGPDAAGLAYLVNR